MVMDLVRVTAPKPPGSRQSISPPAAVLLIAPAKVLQGAVRLHGLTSSPTPDTHVRVACALNVVARKRQQRRERAKRIRLRIVMNTLLFFGTDLEPAIHYRRYTRRDLIAD